jgi:hypothetical protein
MLPQIRVMAVKKIMAAMKLFKRIEPELVVFLRQYNGNHTGEVPGKG